MARSRLELLESLRIHNGAMDTASSKDPYLKNVLAIDPKLFSSIVFNTLMLFLFINLFIFSIIFYDSDLHLNYFMTLDTTKMIILIDSRSK